MEKITADGLLPSMEVYFADDVDKRICENCVYWERKKSENTDWGKCSGIEKSGDVDILGQGYEGIETTKFFYCKEFTEK